MTTKAQTKRPYKRHPWPSWFSRKRFTVLRGKHYAGRSFIFAQQVRNVAFKMGMSVSIHLPEDGPDRVEVTVNREGK